MKTAQGPCNLPRNHLGPHTEDVGPDVPAGVRRCGKYLFERHWEMRECPGCYDETRVGVYPRMLLKRAGETLESDDIVGFCSACLLEGKAFRMRKRAERLRDLATKLEDRATRTRARRKKAATGKAAPDGA